MYRGLAVLRKVADGVFGVGTVAVGVTMILFGQTVFTLAAGLWCCVVGGYVGVGVFDGEG